MLSLDSKTVGNGESLTKADLAEYLYEELGYNKREAKELTKHLKKLVNQ